MKLFVRRKVYLLVIWISLSVSVSHCDLHTVKIEVEGGNAVRNTDSAVITCSYNKTADDPVFAMSFFHTDDPSNNPDLNTAIAAYIPSVQEIPKYSNGFNPPEYTMDIDNIVNGESGSSTLTIASATIIDNRRYWCFVVLDWDDLSVDVNLTVVVSPSSINMSQDGAEVSKVTVTEGTQSNIVCTSFGSNPAIDIQWTLQAGDIEDDITSAAIQENIINEDLTSDSVSTLEYIFNKDYDGGTLTCKTRGDYLAESKSDSAILNIQYVPDVTVTREGNTVICKSYANPPASTHIIEVDRGTLEYRPSCEARICTLSFDVDYDTDVRCNATNAIGTGTATIVEVPGLPRQPTSGIPTIKDALEDTSSLQTTTFPIRKLTTTLPGVKLAVNIAAITIGVLLCIAFILIALLLCQVFRLYRYKNSVTKESTAQSGIHKVPMTYMELDTQSRQMDSAYAEPVIKDSKKSETAQPYEDLNPDTREEKNAYQSMIPKDGPSQGADNVTYEEIPAAKKPQTYVNIEEGRN